MVASDYEKMAHEAAEQVTKSRNYLGKKILSAGMLDPITFL